MGNTIVVDAVNASNESREMWRKIAAQAGKSIYEIELVCSNLEEHKARVENRETDLPGFVPPVWEEVLARSAGRFGMEAS